MESLQNKRIIFFLLVLLTALGAAFWYFPQAPEDNGLEIDTSVYINLDDVELVQGEAGREKWELIAKKSKYFKEEKQIKVYSPKFNFYLKNSTHEISMHAPIGTANPEESEIRLWNGVVANYAGNKMTADSMHYLGKDEKIEFRGGIRLSRKDYLVKSEKASLNLEKQELSFQGEVKVYLGESI